MSSSLHRFVLISLLVLLSTAALAQAAKPAPDVTGTWLGTLDVGALKLRIAFNIKSTPEGLAATMDSLDQGAKGIAVDSVVLKGSTLSMELKRLAGSYNGEVAPDAASVQGTWSQGGGSYALVLRRVKDTATLEPRRPQMPAKPYPYREEEVSYVNVAADAKLAATLTLPEGKGPFPAVLLITGSGPQDRDESIMGHKPFLVLADHLTRKGIAVLRADDRGVGKSTGDFKSATSADFGSDAAAAIGYLKARPEIDAKKIGLIGHSEGGLIAPMLAATDKSISFIVLLAGPGVPGDELLVEQVRALATASGAPPAQIETSVANQREILALLKSEKDNAAFIEKVKARYGATIPEAQLTAITSPWFRYFINYDPATSLRKVICPVLALDGEKDTQVPPAQNIPAIRKALSEGGNKHFDTAVVPGVNHLFQTATTGAPAEYATIEETISPAVLDKVSSWILANVQPANPKP